jgi:3-oxoacyl-[acyl-carrier protein] reductase
MGIGKGVAEAFASEGANLILVARNPAKLNATADELRLRGAFVLSKEPQVIALFQRVVQEHGRVDILVNCAGIYQEAPLVRSSLSCAVFL